MNFLVLIPILFCAWTVLAWIDYRLYVAWRDYHRDNVFRHKAQCDLKYGNAVASTIAAIVVSLLWYLTLKS